MILIWLKLFLIFCVFYPQYLIQKNTKSIGVMSTKQIKLESPNKKLKEIGTQIYYEKLGDIIAKLSTWRLEKDHFITKFYTTPYMEILQQTKTNHAIVQNQSLGLLDTLYDMKETLSRFTFDLNKERVGSNQSKKQKEKESSFSQIRSTWAQKKECLKKLSGFVYTFYSITNTQLNELRKNLGQLEGQQKKIKTLQSQYDTQYGNKFQINSTKKKNKYFELGRAQEALQIFNEQNANYDIFFNLMQGQGKKILEGSVKMFKNLQENLNLFSLYYKNCFQDSIDEDLLENSKKLAMGFEQQLTAFLRNFVALRQRKRETETMVRKQLEEIIWTTLQQISITSWDIEMKTDAAREYKPKKAILTIDYKFIIAENEKDLFETEIYLLDSQIQDNNQDGQIIIKTKKKQKFYLKFESEARQDEFRLHYQKAKDGI